MTQTMLAILAMIIAMLFAFNQQATILREYDSMVKGELEIMASGVALEVLEEVAGHPFDAHTADPDFILTKDFNLSRLAAPGFDYDYTYDEARYIEHFNGTEKSFDFRAGDNTFTFDVDVDVHYVDAGGATASTRTTMKEVVVTVYHERVPNYLAQLKRTVSPTAESEDREV